MYVLASPHLDVGGWGNSAMVSRVLDRTILVAQRNGVALALGCSTPFSRASVGYVGASDGWTDVSQHRRMAWEFDQAPSGNIALTAQSDNHTTAKWADLLAAQDLSALQVSDFEVIDHGSMIALTGDCVRN